MKSKAFARLVCFIFVKFLSHFSSSRNLLSKRAFSLAEHAHACQVFLLRACSMDTYSQLACAYACTLASKPCVCVRRARA